MKRRKRNAQSSYITSHLGRGFQVLCSLMAHLTNSVSLSGYETRLTGFSVIERDNEIQDILYIVTLIFLPLFENFKQFPLTATAKPSAWNPLLKMAQSN
jgi:hypothetical protein